MIDQVTKSRIVERNKGKLKSILGYPNILHIQGHSLFSYKE